MNVNLQEHKEIETLKHCLVSTLKPAKIYLFGSFAEGKQTQDSDFDFYIVMHDNTPERMLSLTTKAYKAITNLRTRAVDIIINKEARFDSRKNLQLTVENEVATKGVLVYPYAILMI